MQVKHLIKYLADGFRVANKTLDLFVISFLFTLPTFFPLPKSGWGTLFGVLRIVIGLLSIGFSLSIPSLLLLKQKQKTTDYRQMIRVTIKNSRRILIPFIVFCVLFFVLFFATVIVLQLVFRPTASETTAIIKNIADYGKGWQPTSLLLISVTTLFIFTPIFFSVESWGFLASLKQSLFFSFKNGHFVVMMILFNIAAYTIGSFIPLGTMPEILVKVALSQYFTLVQMCTTLLYYRKANRGLVS